MKLTVSYSGSKFVFVFFFMHLIVKVKEMPKILIHISINH